MKIQAFMRNFTVRQLEKSTHKNVTEFELLILNCENKKFIILSTLTSPCINYVHSRWGTFQFPVRMNRNGINILTGKGMCITGNTYPHREWGCGSPGMHILIRNVDVPHR